MDFAAKIHDFEKVTEEDGSVSVNFTFKNTGGSPLVIHKAVASCGCTTPIYPKEPIAPGASAAIKVTYNTSGRPGPFNKTITIYSNDADAPNTVLIIKGNVVPKSEKPEDVFPFNMQGLRLKRKQIPLLEAKIGSILTESIEVINTNKTPISLSFNKVPDHIQVTASNSVLKPDETGTITIKYIPANANDYGKREDSFYIVTNNKQRENPNNRINLSAFITEDFSRLKPEDRENGPVAQFSDNRVNFGKMTVKTRKTLSIQLKNAGRLPLTIRKIVPEYDGIRVLVEKKTIPAGKSVPVKIEFNAGTFDGSVVQRVTFITNDPKNSVSRVFVTAQVYAKK